MRGRARSPSTGATGPSAAPSLLVLFLIFTFVFNFVTLKWAAAMQHPWLQTIVLADQREEAARVQERVQGHLNAMAMRLGELQAQMLRLEGLGDRLAKTAGLKPQELPSLQPGTSPGRGGAESSLPSRNLSVQEFSDLVEKLARQMDVRSDQFSVLEALLVHDSANRKFLPTLYPILDGWYSSNFGYRIDPFTGQQSMHEGIDFPAESGTADRRRRERQGGLRGVASRNMVKWSRSTTATASSRVTPIRRACWSRKATSWCAASGSRRSARPAGRRARTFISRFG